MDELFATFNKLKDENKVYPINSVEPFDVIPVQTQVLRYLTPLCEEWTWSLGTEVKRNGTKFERQQVFLDNVRHILDAMSLSRHSELSPILKSTIALYTEPGYPWYLIPLLSDSSKALLESIKISENESLELLETTKRFFLTPQNPAVSSLGSESIHPRDKRKELEARDSQFGKPWRTEQQHSIAWLYMALSNMNVIEIHKQWSFVIPAVLNIADDQEPMIRARGCDLIQLLAKKVGGDFLKRRGIDNVFWQAVIPSLSYLPPSTNAQDSEQLLAAAFKAGLWISKTDSTAKITRLDELLRIGFIDGYSYVRENMALSLLLLNQCREIVLEMGIYSVKHLSSVVKIIVSTLCDPFACLLLGNNLLKLMSCLNELYHERLLIYRYELYRGLISLWKRAQEEQDEIALAEIQRFTKSFSLKEKEIEELDNNLEQPSLFAH